MEGKVRPSVYPSVHPSVHPLVHPARHICMPSVQILRYEKSDEICFDLLDQFCEGFKVGVIWFIEHVVQAKNKMKKKKKEKKKKKKKKKSRRSELENNLYKIVLTRDKKSRLVNKSRTTLSMIEKNKKRKKEKKRFGLTRNIPITITTTPSWAMRVGVSARQGKA
ncbi:hypothetical protein M0802_001827 [Mischocyttarus mexicanus]|nr:hypothetical protein M0802_001827 [Mischocyttarus mexicanus]